jgi:hypothetical protein
MPPSIARLAFASLFLCGTSHAEDSSLKVYLELSDAQLQQMTRAQQAEYRQQFVEAAQPRRVYQYPQPIAATAIAVLTEAQRAKIPALQEALQLQFVRVGAISFHLIDARQEIISCYCIAEEAFVKYLNLTDAQRGELRGRAPDDRLSVLTQEQRVKFEALRTRSPLVDPADEAARLRLIPDPFPRGECLCP